MNAPLSTAMCCDCISDPCECGSNLAAPSTAEDHVTVLQCAKNLKLTKTWQADGSIKNYDNVKTVRYVRRTVRSFDDFVQVLDRIATRTDAALIRGKPYDGVLPNTDIQKNSIYFMDEPHHWLILDVDDFIPLADPIADPEAAVKEYITEELPACFHTAACRWMLSGSAGHPSKGRGLRAHLAFWLTRPYSSAQLATWAEAKGINTDKTLFRPVQWHFMANPVFQPGVADPVTVRYGVIKGDDGVDLLIPEDLIVRARAREYLGAGDELPDPRDKRGVVGAFCRAFNIDDCLEQWGEDLPYEFVSADDARRLTYADAASGGLGGAWVSDCRNWLGNSHNSSPYKGHAVNAFDLMRVHRFGEHDEDDDDLFAGDATRCASFEAMKAWALTLPEVQAELHAMKTEAAVDPASSLDPAAEEGEAEDLEQGPTAEEVIEKLRKLPVGVVASTWSSLSVDLMPVQLDRVLLEVARLTGARLMPLRETLRQYKAELRRQRKIAELQVRAAGREIVSYDPMSSTLHARQVENLILEYLAANDRQHEYVVFSGRICAMVEDRLPHSHGADDDDPESAPRVPTLRALDRAAFLARAEEVVGFTRENDKGEDKPIEVPAAVLMQLQSGAHEAPVVCGLVGHPVVRFNGEILGDRGVHPSGLVVAGAPVPGCRPYSRQEARAAVQRLEESFCSGFDFETPLDKAAALAALFTGVQRKVLDSAPGVLVMAASQNTGKTTLARRLHVILTGRDLPVVTFPPNADEARKTLLALLLRSPALICFDNIPDGLNFRDASLAAVMTSSTWEQRILGVSEPVQVQTNTLFMVTGNNLTLGRDELTRMMAVRLVKPATGRRVFKHADVVGHALEIRAAVIRDVVGIVSGYLKSGTRAATATRFQQWDRCVRQALLWATEGLGRTEDWDVARIFDKNEAGSEEVSGASHVFSVLHEQFGSKRFSARDVVNLVNGVATGDPAAAFEDDDGGARFFDQEARDTLRDAFSVMHCKDPGSRHSVSRVLSAYKGRSAAHPEQAGVFLSLREAVEPGKFGALYVIERTGVGV